jgi:hypothetical protein
MLQVTKSSNKEQLMLQAHMKLMISRVYALQTLM